MIDSKSFVRNELIESKNLEEEEIMTKTNDINGKNTLSSDEGNQTMGIVYNQY